MTNFAPVSPIEKDQSEILSVELFSDSSSDTGVSSPSTPPAPAKNPKLVFLKPGQGKKKYQATMLLNDGGKAPNDINKLSS